MAQIQTFGQLIDLWPSAVALAADLEVKEVTARAWKRRGIPSEYWNRLVAASDARESTRGIVTLELLAQLAAAQSGRAVPSTASEAAA